MTTPWDTGRPAEVGGLLGEVHDHSSLAVMIDAMRSDLRQHPGEWENADLDRYLDGLSAVVGSAEQLMANRGEVLPDQPTWELLLSVAPVDDDGVIVGEDVLS